MAKIIITIEAATLKEAQAAMRTGGRSISYAEAKEAIGDMDAVGLNPERSPLSGKDCQELYRGERRLEASEYGPPKPTEQPSPSPVQSATSAPPVLPTSASTAAPAEESRPPSAGVELDADGLPWDSRIHSSSRKTLAKTGQWKKARGVDADLVARVEAELRQAMAIPGPKLETPAPANTVAEPVSPMAPAATLAGPAEVPAPSRSVFAESDAAAAFGAPLAPKPEPSAPPATAIGDATSLPNSADSTTPVPNAPDSASSTGSGPKTLAELNALVLGAGMQLADVLPAVQKVGLASYALLGTRPDLIPAVAVELGLGG